MGKQHLTRQERLERHLTMDSKKGRQIRHLSDKHQQVVAMTKSGRTNTEIAKALDISTEWVKAVRFSWLGEQEASRLDELRDDETLDLMGKLTKGSELAVDYLLEALTPTTAQGAKFENMPALKVKIALDVLDRNPDAAKVTRIQSSKIVAHATVDDLMRIKKLAKKQQIERTKQPELNVTPKEVQDATT